jgi:threonine synthase
MGFNEYFNAGISNNLPKMMGFQAEGSAPLVLGKTIENPETIATAIRIGNPVNKEKAFTVRKESGGKFTKVSDEEIIKAYKMLGKEEGIFCEPASASSIAGLLKIKDEIATNSIIVCVLTGNGLKDPDCAIKNNDALFKAGIEPNIEIVAKSMGF